jgi:hypothetical protein
MSEYQIDYLENEFESLIDKVQLFHHKFYHKYLHKQVVVIVQIIEKDLVEKQLHVELNK